ncbi:AraC family transcriptional regulator [uncultured Microbacterium sp.]|uniref:AraC family transcriptional regulator n=1 Tax=uncultured Microbacterium sp. TaxID=191216 RepID=UPI0025D37699|nr:AraC family transcriptional regulator [uncultured Microbacterium sp.]
MTVAAAAALLEDRAVPLLQGTSDHDRVVELCTGSLRPHALLVGGAHAHLHTSLSSAPVATSSVNRLRYGAPVTVLPAGPEEETFLFVMPLGGAGELRYGAQETTARAGALYVVGPYEPFRFDFSAAYDQIVVRIPRATVERIAGLESGTRLKVEVPLEATASSAAFISLLGSGLSLPLDSPHGGRMASQIEELLVEAVLAPYAADQQTPARGTHSARTVAAAQEHILENLAEPLSLTSVAMSCGVSVRTLQAAFRRELDTSPGAWIRAQRLERVHRALSEARPDEASVSTIAHQYGFLHLGDFAAQFHTRFGVLPSAVLREKSI